MDAAVDFVEEFLSHRYDPQKAHEYYLRNRELTGRKPGAAAVVPPKSRKNIQEDTVPMKSPTGAKLVDFNGKNGGQAVYSDGHIFDSNGWHKPSSSSAGRSVADAAKKQNDAEKAKNFPRARRIGQAEQKVIRAKTLANKVKDPKAKAALLTRIAAVERKLKAVQNTPTKVGSAKPVLRKTPA